MIGLPLQDMIAGVISSARTKLASEAPKGEPEKVKKLLAYEKHEHGHIPTPKEEDAECEKQASAELCSSEFVEKLASAVEYIATHIDEISPPGPLARAMMKSAMQPGAGGGSAGGKSVPPYSTAGALQTNEAIGGSQKYKKDKAKGEQAEDGHKAPLEKARPHDSKTQLDNNMHDAPGNNHSAVPHTKYPANGPLVAGPSAAHDHGKNGATEKSASSFDNAAKFVGRQFINHPRASAAVAGGLSTGAIGALGGAAGAEKGHRAGAALKGGLAAGALGATVGGSAMHQAGLHLATPAQKAKSLAELAKLASPSAIARQHILMKLAGEDVLRANIDGGGTSSPLAGKGQLRTMKAGEESPTQAGTAANGQDGNSGTSFIGSNSAAINYTKRDAKKLVVSPLKEVLDQPAFSKKHDSKLEENLRNTDKAGVKIAGAAARNQLQKIASQGCRCGSKNVCQYCTMMAKLANMDEMGAGVSPMSHEGGSPDGCTCGGTGECRVCKLKAAMHAAKGGQPGEMKESGI